MNLVGSTPKNTLNALILKNSNYPYHCTISWADERTNVTYWDGVCVEAVLLFGLPGDRYITDISESHMTWSFADSRDALLFKLKFSEALTNI